MTDKPLEEGGVGVTSRAVRYTDSRETYDSMIQRTRMFKTLAILAVSMTATTVLLTHLEPAVLRALPYPLPEQIRDCVRDALASADPIVLRSWTGVEITMEREVARYRPDTLTAVAGTGDYHFRITETGAVWPSAVWRDQRSASGGGAVRIVLADRATGPPIPPLQWASLRVLLAELRGLLGLDVAPDAPGRWVTLSDEAAGDTALCAHLRSEGLLS